MKKLISAILLIVFLFQFVGLNALAADSQYNYHITINVKNYGTIVAELYPDIAPITVENFVKLANEGFYNNLTFHRVISGFIIQGGDPSGNSRGGSSQTIKGEFSANGVENNLSHTRGVLSMARSSSYDSASSQFFIMHQDAPQLDGQYAAFGRVISGMEIVDAICRQVPVINSNGIVEKKNQPVITSITVTKNEIRAAYNGISEATAASTKTTTEKIEACKTLLEMVLEVNNDSRMDIVCDNSGFIIYDTIEGMFFGCVSYATGLSDAAQWDSYVASTVDYAESIRNLIHEVTDENLSLLYVVSDTSWREVPFLVIYNGTVIYDCMPTWSWFFSTSK